MILKKYVKTCLSAVTAAAVMLAAVCSSPAVYADSAGFDNFKGQDQYSEGQSAMFRLMRGMLKA